MSRILDEISPDELFDNFDALTEIQFDRKATYHFQFRKPNTIVRDLKKDFKYQKEMMKSPNYSGASATCQSQNLKTESNEKKNTVTTEMNDANLTPEKQDEKKKISKKKKRI